MPSRTQIVPQENKKVANCLLPDLGATGGHSFVTSQSTHNKKLLNRKAQAVIVQKRQRKQIRVSSSELKPAELRSEDSGEERGPQRPFEMACECRET